MEPKERSNSFFFRLSFTTWSIKFAGQAMPLANKKTCQACSRNVFSKSFQKFHYLAASHRIVDREGSLPLSKSPLNRPRRASKLSRGIPPLPILIFRGPNRGDKPNIACSRSRLILMVYVESGPSNTLRLFQSTSSPTGRWKALVAAAAAPVL